ncbi:MAG: TetR/AcrR family transcriptional regulator [Burkholderiales bacterium]|nr:TetR/AcrR family transcriptional regulator [Burkholderiales bacterium]MDE2434021.1 TetR/AcrR family transcriptional regulator [Burkholderiales bacterium]
MAEDAISQPRPRRVSAKAPAKRSARAQVHAEAMEAADVEDTRTKLLRSAAAEFIEHGFAATDTNRIARRAGFAPQTFYRWYKDKIDIFIQVYLAWEEAETAILSELMVRQSTSLQIAEAYAEGHRSFLIFRRHLRQLAYEYPEVRHARADSRKRHIDRILQWQPRLQASREEVASILLQLERLCDAIAENEFADMGLTDDGALHEAAQLIDRLRTEH